MDILSQLVSLLFRSLVVVLPLTTAWLALRRLILSRTANAWFYAVTCLFAVATVAGLMPWALGAIQTNWIFLIFAAFCPAVWIGVTMLCDDNKGDKYEATKLSSTVATFKSRQPPAPLVLENPDWPGAPIPVFRHSGLAEEKISPTKETNPASQTTTRSLLSVAREMRGNQSSDARRPKLLPPPDLQELPFLTRH